MKILISILIFLFTTHTYAQTSSPTEINNIQLVKNMFANFAEKRDIQKIGDYYSPDFMLVSNNQSFDYRAYKNQEVAIFTKLKSLKVLRYDDIFAKDNKVVSRMVIRLTESNNTVHTFYVMLIAEIKNHKINRIWEITYPSWSDKLPSR